MTTAGVEDFQSDFMRSVSRSDDTFTCRAWPYQITHYLCTYISLDEV